MASEQPTRIFGWAAVSLSLTYKFPQIRQLYESKETAGISLVSQAVQASAYGFYIVHGILIQDPPVSVLGCASLVQSVVIICQVLYYRRQQEQEKAGGVAAVALKPSAIEVSSSL